MLLNRDAELCPVLTENCLGTGEGLIKLDIFDKKDGHGDAETKHDRYDVVCSDRSDNLDYIDDRANPLD